MIKPSFRSRRLSFLPFLFALVFGLLGAAPLINNALYTSNKIFLSWLLIDFQSNNQWPYPIFFWAIAGGFLILGIVRHRRTASSRHMQLNQSETMGMTRTHSPKIRSLLRIGAIAAYLVLICFLCLLAMGGQLNRSDPLYESLSSQGHVYLLSVTLHQQYDKFDFEVSQCDDSGWFCHVIYDASHTVDINNINLKDSLDLPFVSTAELVDAHLQVDVPRHHLFILYHGKGTYHSGKLICPIPSS